MFDKVLSTSVGSATIQIHHFLWGVDIATSFSWNKITSCNLKKIMQFMIIYLDVVQNQFKNVDAIDEWMELDQ